MTGRQYSVRRGAVRCGRFVLLMTAGGRWPVRRLLVISGTLRRYDEMSQMQHSVSASNALPHSGCIYGLQEETISDDIH